MFFVKAKCYDNAAPQRSAGKIEEGFASTLELQGFALSMARIFSTGTHIVPRTDIYH
jgi:hypothetical protein